MKEILMENGLHKKYTNQSGRIEGEIKMTCEFNTNKGRQSSDIVKLNKKTVLVKVKDKNGNDKTIKRHVKKHFVTQEVPSVE